MYPVHYLRQLWARVRTVEHPNLGLFKDRHVWQMLGVYCENSSRARGLNYNNNASYCNDLGRDCACTEENKMTHIAPVPTYRLYNIMFFW